ncbi:MAG: preprotein translocase subunit SecG [Candidatus Thiodiazotropha sp.]
MQTILTVFHILLAVGLVGLILIQHGKGADMGAAFGSGASGTVFGAKGSASFLTRTTAILATLFFVTSIAMGYYATQGEAPKGVMEGFKDVPEMPAAEPRTSDIPPVPAEGLNSDVPAPASIEAAPAEALEPAATDSGVPGAEVIAESQTQASENVSQDGDTSTTSEESPAVEVNKQ